MNEGGKLLAEYAAGSEAAFRELVNRYIDLVYSAAVRLVDGDAHLAQDVAQTVFLDLARAANSLSEDVQLGGWLHRHTCFIAAKMMRARRRRELREQEAAQMKALDDERSFSDAAQMLDAAINQLGTTDRAAIVLRFFEGLDFRAVGAALGSNEDAAQKRVSRALEKLNRLLRKKGVKFGAAALATALTAQAVSAAPVGLAANVATSALLAAPQSGALFSLIKLMTVSKTKMATAALILAAAVSAPIFINRAVSADVQRLERNAADQTGQLVALGRENERVTGDLQRLDETDAREREEFAKLSVEARALRARADQVKELRGKIHQLSLQREGGNYTTWQNVEMWHAKRLKIDAWKTAFLEYARAHDGQLPTTFDEAETFLQKNAPKSSIPPAEEYEIVYQGSLQSLTNLNSNLEFMFLRERKMTPHVHYWNHQYWKKMGRFSAFANGESHWYSSPSGHLDSEFNSFEQEHLASTAR